MMGAMGGSSSKDASSPKSLADLVPGAPALTWDHVSQAYQLAMKGDYENAVGTMLKLPMDGGGAVIMNSLKEGFCTNCTILAIKTDVVNEDGSRMDISNGVYLHHAVSINLGWRSMTNWLAPCPDLNPMMKTPWTPAQFQTPATMFGNTAVDEFQQWFGSPKEYSAQGGLYVSPLDFILLQAEMINYTQKEKKVYINFDYEYVPGRMGKETTFTIASTLGKCYQDEIQIQTNVLKVVVVSDSMPMETKQVLCEARILKSCKAARFWHSEDVSTDLSAGLYVFLETKRMIDMHDGAEQMSVYLNDKLVCETKAIYGTTLKSESGKDWTTISEVTQCTEPVKVKKGDRIALETKLDEIAHPL
jgi:hypothetical protein